MASMLLKSVATLLYFDKRVQVDNKANIKASVNGPLWGNVAMTDGFSLQRASYAERFSMPWNTVLYSLYGIYWNYIDTT